MKTKKNKISIGDKVCYSRQFCRSTGQMTGDIPFARGIVTNLIPLGDNFLAEIDWSNPDIPPRVLSQNLSRISAARGVEEEV